MPVGDKYSPNGRVPHFSFCEIHKPNHLSQFRGSSPVYVPASMIHKLCLRQHTEVCASRRSPHDAQSTLIFCRVVVAINASHSTTVPPPVSLALFVQHTKLSPKATHSIQQHRTLRTALSLRSMTSFGRCASAFPRSADASLRPTSHR